MAKESHPESAGLYIPPPIVKRFERKEITLAEAVTLATIDRFSAEHNGTFGCFATDRYLADKVGVQPRQMRNYIAKLKALDLIRVVAYRGRGRQLETVWNRASRRKTQRRQ